MEKINDKLYNWASDIDTGTILQAEKTARLPFIAGHVALMPDAHVGMGATVGSVIPTIDAIIPAAVGVDIGCGMIANRIEMTADELPDNLEAFFPLVEQSIPAGVGQGHKMISAKAQRFLLDEKHSKFDQKLEKTALMQFGSLGAGNHFFEICLDQDNNVWFVIHSGSRGIGNKLGQKHIKIAKQLTRENGVYLEDSDLAYFIQGQPEFDDYIQDMLWAQRYALENRELMMASVLQAFGKWHVPFIVEEKINCHHNFTNIEMHNGKATWITRKGAIKADVGDKGIIPGSMGTKSYIVSGKGNPDSYNSCSHGAGRRMSRSKAKLEFTEEDLFEAMGDRVWNRENAKHLIDEIPGSYKNIDQVMEDQQDLVEVNYVLHQILNYKG